MEFQLREMCNQEAFGNQNKVDCPLTLPVLSITTIFNSRRKFLYDLKVASEDEQEDALKEMERFCKLLDDEKNHLPRQFAENIL